MVEIIIERRAKAIDDGLFYDPWQDLAGRRGVELTFHNPDATIGGFVSPYGVTNFNWLNVSLRYGLMEVQTRCVLAHELAHLDRGPRAKDVRMALDEQRTDRLAAQRLVDPVVFGAVLDVFGQDPRKYAVHEFLNVSIRVFKIYAGWRRRTTTSTAERVFDEARTPRPWPAPWMERQLDQHPRLAEVPGWMGAHQ